MQGCWTGLWHWLRPEKEETTLIEALVRHSNRIRIWRSSCPQCLDTGEVEDIGRTGKWPCPWCRPVLVGAAAADPDEGWKCDCALPGPQSAPLRVEVPSVGSPRDSAPCWAEA